MSYIDVICVIWCHMRHLMSNDAYDINIWHQSMLPILVSKEASGPQQSHLWVRFWLNNSFKIQKLKIDFGIFFLYKFWKSFVFLDQKYHSPRMVLFVKRRSIFLLAGLFFFNKLRIANQQFVFLLDYLEICYGQGVDRTPLTMMGPSLLQHSILPLSSVIIFNNSIHLAKYSITLHLHLWS